MEKISIESVPVPQYYLDEIDKFSQDDFHTFVRLMYGFIITGGLPGDWTRHNGIENAGSYWATIWKALFQQHNLRISMSEENGARKKENELQPIIQQKASEIARLKDILNNQDPFPTYKEFLKNQDEYNNENSPKDIKSFRVSYRDGDGYKAIRSFEMKFAGSDRRAETSVINGKLGGRPCDPNASPQSIRRRKANRMQNTT